MSDNSPMLSPRHTLPPLGYCRYWKGGNFVFELPCPNIDVVMPLAQIHIIVEVKPHEVTPLMYKYMHPLPSEGDILVFTDVFEEGDTIEGVDISGIHVSKGENPYTNGGTNE